MASSSTQDNIDRIFLISKIRDKWIEVLHKLNFNEIFVNL